MSEPSANKGTAPTAAKLTCRHLYKIYGRQIKSRPSDFSREAAERLLQAGGTIGALRDISLDVMNGETFVVMGLSGSGKSTLLRCLTRLIEPTSGQVHFDDRDLLAASPRELAELRRHKMGMVFQHFALLPHLTTLENVMFPLQIQNIPRKQREQRARQLISLVGLEGREDRLPSQLSGGQQQRVGIARSLAAEPEVWFLDEPFSALDPLIRREMQSELLRLQSVLQKTIVFVTHDFSEAVRLATRIAILKDGEVEQIGTPEEIVLTPASDYVADFTAEIPKYNFISIGGIMSPPLPSLEGPPLFAQQKLSTAARSILESDAPQPVRDNGGRIVGSIGKAEVVRALFPGAGQTGIGG